MLFGDFAIGLESKLRKEKKTPNTSCDTKSDCC